MDLPAHGVAQSTVLVEKRRDGDHSRKDGHPQESVTQNFGSLSWR